MSVATWREREPVLVKGIQAGGGVATVLTALVALGVIDVQQADLIQRILAALLGLVAALAPVLAAVRARRESVPVATIRQAGLDPAKVLRDAADPSVAAWREVAG